MSAHKIAVIDAWHLKVPIQEPVITSFGTMTCRQAVWVRLEDADGAVGWGEIWCNFPEATAAYRLTLLERLIGPWLLAAPAMSPVRFMEAASSFCRIVAIQAAEAGPFAAVISGLDQAFHDLAARKQGVSLAAALAGTKKCGGPVPAYASGINPADALDQMLSARENGYRAFKLKIGFPSDQSNIDALCGALEPGERLMLDANQAFDLPTAEKVLRALEGRPLTWLEEPVSALSKPLDLVQLAQGASIPLAGGENVISQAEFADLITLGAYRFIQPDIAKWGGISRNHRIAQMALDHGLTYCPHYLGGGIGLLHSAHLLQAVGGGGMLEIDVNANPLRDQIIEPPRVQDDGTVMLPEGVGIGAEPDLKGAWAWTERHVSLGLRDG